MSSNNLLEEVERFKEEYYKTNRKNIFFKKSQKQDFARKVSDNFNINELLEKTIYIDSLTYRVFVDYNVFKLYANDDTYQIIKNHAKNVFYNIHNKSFEFHIDINGFTISAAERYKSFFEMMFSEFMVNNEDLITKIYIYNSPSIIDTLMVFFKNMLTTNIKSKIIIVPKSI
jgi:hypothetical protein